MSHPFTEVVAIVEGSLDEAVVLRLFQGTNLEVIPRPQRGKSNLLRRTEDYLDAARTRAQTLWFILLDLDQDPCAPLLLSQHNLLETPPNLLIRVAVRSVEAWLIADANALARFLRVDKNDIPPEPERLPDPKTTLINLARKSRNPKIRKGIPPLKGSLRRVGPAYNSYVEEFILERWEPWRAAGRAPSLKKALRAIEVALGGAS